MCHGLPSSGKTTLSKNLLLGHFGSQVYLSTDDLLTRSGKYLWSGQTCYLGHKLLQELFKEAIKLDTGLIIIDNTNLKFKDIQVYVENTPSHYEIEVVEPQTEWRYNIQECFKRGSHAVPLETLQRMLDSKESRDTIQRKINEFRKSKVS